MWRTIPYLLIVNMVSGKKSSTCDLMALLTETWNRSVQFFSESKIVTLDISKAFDRVWHQGHTGNTFIRWLSDFLYNRSIYVVIDGTSSNLYPVNSGVPQDSVSNLKTCLFVCRWQQPSFNAHPNPNEVFSVYYS